MRKDEFEALAGLAVSDSDYEVIEKVYTFHPAIRETSGKEEVAELYKSFGMAIFCDMLPRAEKNCELEKQLRHAQAKVEQIKGEMEELSCGNAPKRMQVTSGALDRTLEMWGRQRKRDRERLADMGVHVNIFQSDSSDNCEQTK